MLIEGRNYKTSFILGAGASRGAIHHVLVNRKRIKPPLNKDFFKIAETYAKSGGLSSINMRRFERLQKVFKEEVPFKRTLTMEEAFSLLYVAKDFPQIYKQGRGKKPAAGSSIEIEDFLRLTFDILLALDSEENSATKYDSLVSKLGPNDTIISLNYDTLLDSALVRGGWDPKEGYGLSGGKNKIKWRPAISESGNHLKGVRLLKVHGSVNWFVRGSYANLSKAFSSKPVQITSPRKNVKQGHIRQIVPPIYGKIFEHDHWRKLWTQGFNELCSSEILVVIGCSLIETDFHLNALLSRMVKHRKSEENKFKSVIFVADTKTRNKWRKALRGCYFKIKGYPRFDQFIKRGLKI
jgi:hypothetical protein